MRMVLHMSSVLIIGVKSTFGLRLSNLLIEKGINIFGLDSTDIDVGCQLPVNDRFKFVDGLENDPVLVEALMRQVEQVIQVSALRAHSANTTMIRGLVSTVDLILNSALRNHKKATIAVFGDTQTDHADDQGDKESSVEAKVISSGQITAVINYLEYLTQGFSRDGLDVQFVNCLESDSEQYDGCDAAGIITGMLD